jgi:hypothetical protein
MASGCLSMHSFVFTSGVPISRPALSSVQLSTIVHDTHRLSAAALQTQSQNARASSSSDFVASVVVRQLREYIDTAFSSISVLNASFRDNPLQLASTSATTSTSNTGGGSGLSIQLENVRLCYTVLFNTENDALIATLGRATLSLSSKLIECPFDDPENLSVFLIVLENPLLLEPDKFSVAIERVRAKGWFHLIF